MKNIVFIALWLCSVNVFAAEEDLIMAHPFQCAIIAPAEQQLNHGIFLIIRVTNLTAQKLQLLSWYTPFEGFLSELFIITNTMGNRLDYNGIFVKRTKPTQEDFVEVQANDYIEIKLELIPTYSFTRGEYSVQLASKPWTYALHNEMFTTHCIANIFKFSVL